MRERVCDNEEQHEPHEYYKDWSKATMPFLPGPIADQLPDAWTAIYQCPGVDPVFCTACGGPYEDMELFGKHWDTCPNRIIGFVKLDNEDKT